MPIFFVEKNVRSFCSAELVNDVLNNWAQGGGGGGGVIVSSNA